MNKKAKYDPFEILIRDKVDGLESDYGKDWDKISSRLDNTTKNSSKNKNTLLIIISFLIGIGLLTVFLLNNNSENITPSVKEIKKNEHIIKIIAAMDYGRCNFRNYGKHAVSCSFISRTAKLYASRSC